MSKWNVTPLPGAMVENRDCTLPMCLVQVEASSYEDAIQQGQAVYFLQGYKFPKSKLAAALDEGPLPSWNVYLKTGPLVTYPSIEEEEALKRLAKMCDEWGLSVDSFVLERAESDESLRWGIHLDGTLLPWTVTTDYKDACVRAEEIRVGATNVEVRKIDDPQWEVYDRLSKKTVGPFSSKDSANAESQRLQSMYIGSDFEVRRVQG